MQEGIAQILLVLHGAWRFRWYGIAAAWLLAVVGWVGVQFIPDRYQSTTKVYVDTESLLKPLLSGLAVNRDVMSQVAIMQAVMLSRPSLEKVAHQMDLLLVARTKSDEEAILESLARRIQLTRPMGPGNQNTFLVTFEDTDRTVAHEVVRMLLDTFMENSLGLKRSDAGVAERFLQSQVDEYERRLTESEQRLASFKQNNVGLLPGSGGDYYQKLEAEMGTLQSLQQRHSQLKPRRDELQRQLDGEEPTFGLMGSTEGSPIDGQIGRLKAERDQLLLQYTEKHPQVQSLNNMIAQLEDEKRSGARISQSVAPPGAKASEDEALVRSLDVNPVYQSLRLALSQADADLAELNGQIAAQQSVVAQLRRQVTAIPEVEAELTRLNRDYEVNKQQYETLLQRLGSAQLSQEAEQNTENVKFRVIEPPTVPVRPSGPPRRLLNSIVLLGALGAGFGLALVFAQLHPTFTTRDQLQKVTGVTVLGSVTAAVPAGAGPWYRSQPVLVGGAVSLLLVVYAINVLLSEPLRAALRGVIG